MADTVREPQQDRSRDKLERIYEVSVELLVEGGWDAVTVGNVERRAGVSRGAFYLRFPNREALLDYTHRRLVDTVNRDHTDAFTRARAVKADTLDSAVRAAVEATVGIFRVHGGALRRLDRGESGGPGADAMNQLSRDFRSVLEPVTGSGPAQRGSLEFAVQIVLAMVQLQIHPRVTFTTHSPRDWQAFVDELCDVVHLYLRARIPLPDPPPQ